MLRELISKMQQDALANDSFHGVALRVMKDGTLQYRRQPYATLEQLFDALGLGDPVSNVDANKETGIWTNKESK